MDLFPARYRDGAFIAFYGSWNCAPFPRDGYNVVFQPVKSESAPVATRSSLWAIGHAER
jgi:glucose/arabinose dehydrogenase